MNKLPFISIAIDEHVGDTLMLSLEEDACYTRLVMQAWRNGGYLPNDDIILANAARITVEKWMSIRPAVEALFEISKRGWFQQRMLSEISRIKAQLKGFTYSTKENMEFFESERWQELRAKTLRRYGAVCMKCGAGRSDDVIHIDHIKPRSIFPELQWDPDNLQVLCYSCNIEKSNKNEIDYRGYLKMEEN